MIALSESPRTPQALTRNTSFHWLRDTPSGSVALQGVLEIIRATLTITEASNVSDAMAFFRRLRVPLPLLRHLVRFYQRRTLAFEKVGSPKGPAGITEVLITCMGIFISVWLFIGVIVHTGMSISSNA